MLSQNQLAQDQVDTQGKQAKNDIKRFGFTTILGESGSNIIDQLFELSDMTNDEKEQMKTKITEMIFNRLDEN